MCCSLTQSAVQRSPSLCVSDDPGTSDRLHFPGKKDNSSVWVYITNNDNSYMHSVYICVLYEET